MPSSIEGDNMNFKMSDKELKETLKKMVVLVDTREKSNKHITDWFDKNKIKYKVKKLDYADYSVYLPAGSIKGIERDIYFTDSICIERKNSIDEVAGNFKDDAVRLKNELLSLNKYDVKYFIFLEDALFHKHIRNGNFRSMYDSKTLYARFKGLEAEFNTVIVPISKEYMASEIYNTLYYHVRAILKREFEIDKYLIDII